ncbi:ATP-binding cassette domain-containing protein [Vibrio sp.]|nr:ATP-binding cassette domain-containing protein [Vibrio sp.]
MNLIHIDIKQEEHAYLNNIQFDMSECGILGILGPNGAGKSSLLHYMAELTSQNAFPQREVNHPIACYRAVVTQMTQSTIDLCVLDVILLGGYALQAHHLQKRVWVEELATQFSITHLLSRSYDSLSGGQKQLIHILRAFLQLKETPKHAVLLLDEPTSALDLAYQKQVLKTLKTYCQQQAMCIVIILHDLNLAARYADYILMIKEGHQIAFGRTKNILTPNNIKTVFDYDALILPHPTEDYPIITEA